MSPQVTADANDNGGATIKLFADRREFEFALSKNSAFQFASRILSVLGVSTLTNNPDGTYTAR